jgi:hypothetical protein
MNQNNNNYNPARPPPPNYAQIPIFLSNWNQRGPVIYWNMPANHQQQYKLYCNLWFFFIVHHSMWTRFKRALEDLPVIVHHGDRFYNPNQMPIAAVHGDYLVVENMVLDLMNEFVESYHQEKVRLMSRLSETLQTFLEDGAPNIQLQNLPTDRQGNGIQPPLLRQLLPQHLHSTLHTILLYFQEIEESFVTHRDRYMGEFQTIVHNGTRYIVSASVTDTIYPDSVHAGWEPIDIMEQFMDDTAEYP